MHDHRSPFSLLLLPDPLSASRRSAPCCILPTTAASPDSTHQIPILSTTPHPSVGTSTKP